MENPQINGNKGLEDNNALATYYKVHGDTAAALYATAQQKRLREELATLGTHTPQASLAGVDMGALRERFYDNEPVPTRSSVVTHQVETATSGGSFTETGSLLCTAIVALGVYGYVRKLLERQEHSQPESRSKNSLVHL